MRPPFTPVPARAVVAAIAVALASGVVAAAAPLAAQPAAPATDTAVVAGARFVVPSAALAEPRPIQVHLPPSYASSRTARYPVLYLLDGPAHFESVSAMADFLARNGRVPEMIVVAVGNTGDRTRDLTPPKEPGVVKFALSPGSRDSISETFPTAGGAARLRAFLTTELRPWVEARYRTVPYRILVGHSFGGLFAVDALSAEPRAFNAYVAISPSLWWDGGRFVERARAALARAPLDGIALYMTTGEREPDMIPHARALANALRRAAPTGFRSWYKVMPGETHGSVPFRTTYDALEQLFAGWEPPDDVVAALHALGQVEALDAHHAAVSRRFGFPVETSLDQVNQAGYVNLAAKRVDAAVRLFRRNVETAPDYANGWDSLADGLEAQGKLDEAIAAQERAVTLGEAQKDPALGAYRAHLERLRGVRR